jgi:hypothetical protein
MDDRLAKSGAPGKDESKQFNSLRLIVYDDELQLPSAVVASRRPRHTRPWRKSRQIFVRGRRRRAAAAAAAGRQPHLQLGGGRLCLMQN